MQTVLQIRHLWSRCNDRCVLQHKSRELLIMARRKRSNRILLGPLIFIFVFSVLSAAAGIWINGRFYEMERDHEAHRANGPRQRSQQPPDSLPTDYNFGQRGDDK